MDMIVSFSDDCFTSDRKRLIDICDEIVRRGVSVDWDCLSRVDRIDLEVARKMKQAGCVRTYFGLESGNNTVLSLMKKQITTEQAEEAVRVAKASGIQVGAFFILGYPGETDETVLDTVRFASSLPLDYVSFTLPYPIPGTPLYARMKDKLISDDLESRHLYPTRHKLLYRSSFSEAKIQFAVMKAAVQFRMKRGRGKIGADFVSSAFERITDSIFRLLP